MSGEKVIHIGKSRVWTASIVAALVASIAVFVVMMQLEKNMLTQYEKGVVLVAAKEIPKGQMLTRENCGSYFVEMELDKSCISPTALVSMEQVTDMVPIADIEKGVLLTGGMFEEVEEITAGMQNPVIAGFKAEDLYQVVGGVLRIGDRINIYHVAESGEVSLDWKELFVQQVFDNAGNSIANQDSETAAQRINVYLDEDDVEKFYAELTKGTLRVVKVCE